MTSPGGSSTRKQGFASSLCTSTSMRYVTSGLGIKRLAAERQDSSHFVFVSSFLDEEEDSRGRDEDDDLGAAGAATV